MTSTPRGDGNNGIRVIYVLYFFSGRYDLNPERGRKPVCTLRKLDHLIVDMTSTPRGDGNLIECREVLGSPRPEVDMTSTPRGDGNWILRQSTAS